MVYIVKWIPKDQDVTIDHSTRYEHPSQALEFACNALQLSPKKIWIEDDKGTLHTDHQAILEQDRKRRESASGGTIPAMTKLLTGTSSPRERRLGVTLGL